MSQHILDADVRQQDYQLKSGNFIVKIERLSNGISSQLIGAEDMEEVTEDGL